MSTIVIQGGRRLQGRIRISGRKNAALPILAAALVTGGRSVLESVPNILDVRIFLEMLGLLGTEVNWQPDDRRLVIDAAHIHPADIPHQWAGAMRASYYLVGVQLALFGEASVPLPGGDRIGQRPVDQHVKALTALGADVQLERGLFRARVDRACLRGAPIYFDLVSVGATIHAMLVATLAEGLTVLRNAAREPHVVDVANFLNGCGARISGAGTDTIRIRGGRGLHGCTHSVIPDDIEAATFMIAAAATRGDVALENVIPWHLRPVTAKLREAGVRVEENGDHVRVSADARPTGIHLTTLPYPGFPTDAQSQMTALLAIAEGQSTVTETLYDDRFRFVPELVRMGAQIRVEGRSCWIQGVERFYGGPVEATDLRAAAALVVAGLAAEGTTEVRVAEHLDRGYEDLPARLVKLGGIVERRGP